MSLKKNFMDGKSQKNQLKLLRTLRLKWIGWRSSNDDKLLLNSLKSIGEKRELIIDFGKGESCIKTTLLITFADANRLINEDFDDDMVPRGD